jgi:hypothetical protein
MLPPGARATLNRCQHAGQRHSTAPRPAASTDLLTRHPYEVVSVVSPFVSGDIRAQSVHF